MATLASVGARAEVPVVPAAHAAASGTGGASGTELRAGPSDQWVTIVPGAERLWTTVDGSAEVFLVRFDLDHFRAEVVVGKGSPPQRRTAADVRAGRGAVAAVNGGFFDPGVVPLGLRIAGGDQRYPLRPKADWGVLVLAGHRARIVHTREYPPAPTVAAEARAPGGPAPVAPAPAPIDGAIQVGPRLIAGGQALKLRTQLARRTAVALDRDG
ncbi:MAG TPA: phosphodiester glycosidase family protein, partial [Polyangia bacterium]